MFIFNVYIVSFFFYCNLDLINFIIIYKMYKYINQKSIPKIYLTNLKVYEETNDKDINKCVWSRYQITFYVKNKYHRRYDACFSSAIKDIFYFK